MNRNGKALITLITLISGLGYQTTSASPADAMMEAAKVTVERYKALRSSCSESEGIARLNCFKSLRQTNQQYKEAKVLLNHGYIPKVEKPVTQVTYIDNN